MNVYGTKKTFVNHTADAEIFLEIVKKIKLLINLHIQDLKRETYYLNLYLVFLKNKEPIVSGKDIFRVMDVCFSIIESYKKRKTIKISYLL